MQTALIASTHHAWRGDGDGAAYADEPGSCRAATLDEIRAYGHVRTAERHVGVARVADDGPPFAEKMAALTRTLEAQFAESAQLEAAIRDNLERLGFLDTTETGL
jgi:type I restriction enzyme M protein